MIRWVEFDAYGRCYINIAKTLIDMGRYKHSNLYPVMVDDLPKTKDQVSMHLMLFSEHDKSYIRQSLEDMMKIEINWVEGEALSTHWEEYMCRTYTDDGKLSEWGVSC